MRILMKGDWVSFLKDVYGDFEENKHIINYVLKRSDEENIKLLASCFEDAVIAQGDIIRVPGLREGERSIGFYSHREPSERYFEYICMRYGFKDGQAKTYKTLSENLNLSKTTISRVVDIGLDLLRRHTLRNKFFNFELSDKTDCYVFNGKRLKLINRYNEMMKVLPAYICVVLQEANLNSFDKLKNMSDEEFINKKRLKEEDIKLIRDKMDIMRHINKNGHKYIIGIETVCDYGDIVNYKLYKAGINNFLDLIELNKEDLMKIINIAGSDRRSEYAEEVIEERDNLVKMLKEPNTKIEEMQSIECLNLDTKEVVILHRCGCFTIGSLKSITVVDLLKTRGCGQVLAEKIISARDEYFGNLNQDETDVDPIGI